MRLMGREQAIVNKQPMDAKCCQSDNMNDNICKINGSKQARDHYPLQFPLFVLFCLVQTVPIFHGWAARLWARGFSWEKKKKRLFWGYLGFCVKLNKTELPYRDFFSNSSIHLLAITFHLHFEEKQRLLIQDW